MTDPMHGQNTGGDAPGTPEPHGAGTFFVPAKPRFAAEQSVPADAHSPASPYTVTSTPRPARALPTDDDDEQAVPVVPNAPVVPVAQVVPVVPLVLPPAAVPDQPVPILAQPDPVPAQQDPIPSTEPDEFIEPPLIPRPYAVSTPAYAPGPPPYSPPTQAFTPPGEPTAAPPQPYTPTAQPPPSSTPTYIPAVPPSGATFQPYTTAVPPPATQRSEAPHPFAAPTGDDAPPVAARPYAQPGYGAHTPAPLPIQGEPPAYGSSLEHFPSYGGPAVPAVATGFGAARPRTERVGRGLLLALVAVVGGCVLSAVVYHLGYVASIVALAMGGAGIFLYAKGAGSPPRKGAVALVVLLMAGILLAWVSSVATELYFYYVSQTGSSNGALVFAVNGALSLDLFKATLKDFLIFVGFGALGVFGVARQLLVPRKVK